MRVKARSALLIALPNEEEGAGLVPAPSRSMV
jgi:hypothetical protein